MNKRKKALMFLGGTDKPWYLSGNTLMPISAYKATGAADFATSLVNLANPGTLDLVDGTTPTYSWSKLTGWFFLYNDAGGYLRTGITTSDGDITILIRFIGGLNLGNTQVYCGVYEDPGGIFYIQNALAGLNYSAPNTISTTRLTPGTTHTLAIAGTKAYLDGVQLDGTLTKNAITSELFIGALNLAGTGPIQGCGAQITHFAYWDKVLTAENIASVTNAISLTTHWNALQTAYVNQGFGVMITWDMNTERPYVGVQTIDNYNPTGLDVGSWLDAIESSGATYAVMPANGIYGFANYPTAFHNGENPPFSVAQTDYYAANGSPDPLALFVAGCATRGINPCFYYRLINEKFQDETGYTMVTNPVEYANMFKAQLTELLTNYGDIGAIWVDGWDVQPGGTNISFDEINAFVKAIQPNCLLINNSHVFPMTNTEIETHENTDYNIFGDTATPKEFTKTIYLNSAWYYYPLEDQTATGLVTSAEIKERIEYINNRGGTYLLSIAPGYDGLLPAAQVTILGEVGT